MTGQTSVENEHAKAARVTYPAEKYDADAS